MTAPSPDSIKESVEKSEKWVDWLVEVLRSKNPIRKLLLLDVLLCLIFNPFSFPTLLHSVTGKDTPVWYSWIFWPVIGLLSLTAVITAYRIKQRESKASSVKWNERSAIKGLLPFVYNDAELFSRLQREDDFRQCLPVLTDPQFRFGLLCGESGCGKTSFLQAGVWPRLMELGHRCLYIKLTDLDPLDSIRLALIDQFKLPKEAVNGVDLLALMEAALQVDSQPIILLFDQFEQFFVHQKQAKHRKPFVQSLAAWYRGQPPLPVRLLICLREDFAGRMIELQKAMGYSLGPQQNIRLEKFEPEQAAKIFQVIAETEQVSLDESFVNEFTQQELASRDDGLISPVDIQILAWMLAGQKSQDERAFNRASFQKLGGIEGLLERFLTRALEARETESRRQSAIKVLLALTDLDGNARAGVLTLAALKEKLDGSATDTEVTEALTWLIRADVRLVTPIDDGYELAHERLIPALRRIAGRELTTADKANQLLDRRVNEWLGNNRASRYLLAWREWRLIERQRPYLVWGPQEAHKASLLLRTQRRWRFRIVSVVSLLVTVLSIWISYNIWLNSDAGQIYQIKNDLLRLSEGINDQELLHQIVAAFIAADMPQQATQMISTLQDPASKSYALCALAESIEASDPVQSANVFEQSLNSAKDIFSSESRAYVLCALAESVERKDINKSRELFDSSFRLRGGQKC